MALQTRLRRPLKSPSSSLYAALKCKHFYKKPTNSNSKNELPSSAFNSSCRNPEALDRFLKERCRSALNNEVCPDSGGIEINKNQALDQRGIYRKRSRQSLHKSCPDQALILPSNSCILNVMRRISFLQNNHTKIFCLDKF
ncbi:hypothetical protein Dsin_030012 [Dipteronia sinensis]|uniref:Uncharacterized protein n=1 Tax=Dipteronia sinensis TaxID=43782 RepID=A0AAD9ZID6_9ROSI|nr:hypothetical protein Dsin_030012 [Dipteronia sinensis]